MSDRDEQAPETRGDDEAMEEIRLLFARYRRIARHGMVAERVEQAEPRNGESNDVPALAGH